MDAGAGARAGARDRRHQAAHQRTGVLHAGRQLHPRRGAGGAGASIVGAGFNAFGIASAGGAGRALAEWIAAGEPPMDLWPVDIRRFGASTAIATGCARRTLEAYGKHYTMAWPHEEHRERPAAARLAALRAAEGAGRVLRLEARLGAAELVRARRRRSRGRLPYGRQNWFDARRRRASRRRASASRCSTSPPSPSSCSSAATPRRR